MKKIQAELNRRNLLRYAGNSIVFFPLIRTLAETQVFGQDAAPKRAVFFFYPDGIISDLFHPAVGALGTLPDMTKPLERVKNDIIMLRDTNYETTESHEGGMNYALTGYTKSQVEQAPYSIDTYLGQKFTGAFPVIRLGIASTFEGGGQPQSASFIKSGRTLGVREDNPTKAFNDIFGGQAPTPGTGPTPAPTSGLSAASKKSLLDDNREQLASLSTKLASVEKVKLDSHLEAIRELERRANNATNTGGGEPGQACTKTINQLKTFEINDTNYPKAFQRIENYDAVAKMQAEIAIQALACRITNVVYIQHSHSVCTLPWFNGQPGAGGKAHHDYSHYDAEGNIPDYVKAQQYMMNKLADLIEGMSKCAEGDKSLLYNSVVMAFSEIADGAKHSFGNVGTVLAGQAGGYFKTGRCVSGGNVAHNRTLVSILKAMGLPDNSFGHPGSQQDEIAALKG